MDRTSHDVTYFDSFGADHIPKWIKQFIGKRYNTTNIFRIQACDSIMSGYLCVGFVNFMCKGTSLLD